MGEFLVRVEAVNLDVSVFDTDDLSTIRGGGYANLLIPEDVLKALGRCGLGEMVVVFTGASQAVGTLNAMAGVDQQRIEAELDAFASGRREMPGADAAVAAVLPHLSIIGAAVDLADGYEVARRRAVAAVRTRQLTRPTLDIGRAFDTSALRPCRIDGMRPATDGDDGEVSAGVAARRRFGRGLRQRVYKRILGRDRSDLPIFADSFADLVEDPPAGLPPTLQSKIAVVHFDGNAFTRIREAAIAAAGGKGLAPNAVEAKFADVVKNQRAKLLDAMIDAFSADARMFRGKKLRFETLMWGGDEAVFVVPAWKVADLVGLLARQFADRGWTFDDKPLTHGIGVLACQVKMPIATARALVSAILDGAKAALPKEKPDNSLSIQMIESIEPPAGSLGAFRRQLYGTDEPTAFTIVGADRMLGFVDLGRKVTDPQAGLPKSQLFGLIEAVRHGGNAAGHDIMADAVAQTVRRSLSGAGDDERAALVAALTGEGFGRCSTHGAFGLMRLAEMWELLRPFARDAQQEAA